MPTNQKPLTMSAEREASCIEPDEFGYLDPRIEDLKKELDAERAVSAALLAALEGCVNEINRCDQDHKRVVFEAALNAVILAKGRHAD